MSLGQVPQGQNNISESAKSQFLAHVEGEVVQEELDKQNKKKNDKAAKSVKTDAISVLEGESKVSDLVRDVASKMAKSSLYQKQEQLQQKMAQSFDNSVESMFKQENAPSFQDQVALSAKVVQQKAAQLQQKQNKQASLDSSQSGAAQELESAQEQKQTGLNQKNLADKQKSAQSQTSQNNPQTIREGRSQGTQELVKRYIATLADSWVSQNPEKKKESRRIREQVLSTGFSLKRLQVLEKNVQRMVHHDLKNQIKKGFIDMVLVFSKETTPTLLAKHKEFKMLSKMGEIAGVFGEGRTDIEDLRQQAKNEVRGFISDELDSSLTRSASIGKNPIKQLSETFDKFNTIAGAVRFDAAAYMQTFHDKLDDLGLTFFESPGQAGVLDTEAGDTSDHEHHQNPRLYEQQEEDPEWLMDQLRTLYMQKYIKSGIKNKIEIVMKIRNLKQRLNKSGAGSKKIFDKLENEGRGIAKLRLSDLVKESLEERATLPELKGPKFRLVRGKLKTGMAGLKRLEDPIPSHELKQLRDDINTAMFSIIKMEFAKVEVYIKSDPHNVALTQRHKELKSILERLKEESNIKESLSASAFQGARINDDGSIIEAA